MGGGRPFIRLLPDWPGRPGFGSIPGAAFCVNRRRLCVWGRFRWEAGLANRDNPWKGSQFEKLALDFFRRLGLHLQRRFTVDVGIGLLKKPHKFDLGSATPPVLVECKRHTWTEGGNAPSAKLTVWNEAMYYFTAAPPKFRKILFVLKSVRNGETLAQHYIKRYKHLIPYGVELWEYDPESEKGICLYTGAE
jgi:hypothetical protein